jgi:hypothetical protein
MRSSHRSQAHPDTRLGPDPCSHTCGNRLRSAVLAYPTTRPDTMSDDSAAHNRLSSAPASDTNRTSASGQTENAGDVHDDFEWVEQMQMCAREFVHLLHRMPVSSGKKQTAIRLLVKVVRLVTPDELHRSATDDTASNTAVPNTAAFNTAAAKQAVPSQAVPSQITGNGTVSTGSSRAGATEPSEGAPDLSDPRSDRYEVSSRQPSFPHRRVAGL